LRLAAGAVHGVELAGERGAVEETRAPGPPRRGALEDVADDEAPAGGVLRREALERVVEDDVLARAVAVDEDDTRCRLRGEERARDGCERREPAAAADEH